MPIYEMTQNRLELVPTTTFVAAQVRERDDLQRLLRDQIEVVAPDVLLISEEFEDFVGARRRIDLLGLDRSGRLVVIELKRTEDGGHSDLQAIRYASMVSAMSFDQVVEQRARFAAERGFVEPDSRAVVLGWVAGQESLADDVRIILIAANFGIELTTAVLWLTQRHDLDITCVRAAPYALDGRLLLDVQQVVPLPEAADYQVSVRRREEESRQAVTSGRDFTRYSLVIDGLVTEPLAKQQAVKRAVVLLVERGVPLPVVREAVGARWKRVLATSAAEIAQPDFGADHGMSGHWWFDVPFADETEVGLWWVMVRVGGTETERVLERLTDLRPDVLGWQRAETT